MRFGGGLEPTGVAALDNLFKKLPVLVQEKITAQANRAGARILIEQAKQLAPVASKPTRIKRKGKVIEFAPGQLRDGIRLFSPKDEPYTVYVSVSRKGMGFVAPWIEYGTVKMPARPFMRPAFDTKKNEIKDTIRKVYALKIRLLVKQFKQKNAK